MITTRMLLFLILLYNKKVHTSKYCKNMFYIYLWFYQLWSGFLTFNGKFNIKVHRFRNYHRLWISFVRVFFLQIAAEVVIHLSTSSKIARYISLPFDSVLTIKASKVNIQHLSAVLLIKAFWRKLFCCS